MMDTTTCNTIVLVLLWLSLWLQALGFLLTLLNVLNNTVLPTTTSISTVMIGVCLWQCKKAGYLVSPMTWYHWVLLVLLVLLQVMAIVLEHLGQQTGQSYVADWTYPIYGIVVVLLGILGGTLYCGWKCNLFCRPCCKSQYICYGSAIVVVLVVLGVLAVTASMVKYHNTRSSYMSEGDIEKTVIQRLSDMMIPITQFYAMAVLWNTTVRLPYTVLEVVSLISSAVAVASILSFVVSGTTLHHDSNTAYPFLAVHLVALGITWYCLEYKKVFYWPKEYMCFGVVAMVLLVALLAVVITNVNEYHTEAVKYTLLGYSIILIVPTLWYAYRCGLLTWRWNSCLPKKKNLNGTDTAENTTADTDIAKES